MLLLEQATQHQFAAHSLWSYFIPWNFPDVSLVYFFSLDPDLIFSGRRGPDNFSRSYGAQEMVIFFFNREKYRNFFVTISNLGHLETNVGQYAQ